MSQLKSIGVCVRAWDWSETSQTAALLTPDLGLVRVLAKGSKRQGAPFSGGLEIGAQATLELIDRPSSELALLTSWDLTEPFLGIRAHLDRYRVAMIALELVPRMMHDRDPHPGSYTALVDLLSACAHEPFDLDNQGFLVPLRFLWTLLDDVGAMPVLDQDAVSGDPLDEHDVYGFSPEHGGMTKDPGPESPDDRDAQRRVWRVRAATRHVLMMIAQGADDTQFSDVPSGDLRRACTLLAAYTSERVGAEIPSMRWLLAHTPGVAQS